MAGRGPAPKAADQRRRRNEPARGEWVDLVPFERRDKRVLPAISSLPKPPMRGGTQSKWTARTRAAWTAWRNDPATRQFGPAEVQAAVDTIFLYEEMARGAHNFAGEIRLRLDGLGLTAKGKRDLRWRVPPPGEVVQLKSVAPPTRERKVRAVEAVA